MAAIDLKRSRGSLEQLFSGRDNAVGLIRLVLAVSVVVSHTMPLGFAGSDVGFELFGRQTNLGTLSVFGFFVLSGMLITRSARRTGIGAYFWHRALRILPALWVCLLVTVLILAPVVALHERGTLDGLYSQPRTPGSGALAYLEANWWTGLRQFGIQDLLIESTPYGRLSGVSVFNGPLWSLSYEMFCYVVVAVLAVLGVLRRARLLVLLLTVGAYLFIVRDFVAASSWSGPFTGDLWTGFELPLVGNLSYHFLIYLGFLFLMGATFELFREKIPVHDGLGIASAIALIGSLIGGGFYVIGFPALAYLLIWLAVRLPRQVHWVGRKNDYSYGIYIYGFLGQQVLAGFGANRWGFVPFAAISLATAFIAAFLSWHLVERHALRLKSWQPANVAAFSGWIAARRRGTSAAVESPDQQPAAQPPLPDQSKPHASENGDLVQRA